MSLDVQERFRAGFERLAGRAPDPDHRLGLAVSGGPDSLALLLLAHETWPRTIAVATVDHGLRPESAGEAAHVATICAELGVPHAILTPEGAISGNLQAGARAARYALLARWRADQALGWIATAHHADDQIETMVMRLLRGSGVAGLAAIRPVNGAVIRPLLGFRKADLEAIVAGSPFEAIDDPSNADPRFDRARLRAVLSQLPDVEPDRLTRTARAMDEAEQALDWAAAEAAPRAIARDEDGVTLDPAGYPRAIVRRLALACLATVEQEYVPPGPALDDLLVALEAGETRTIGAILCKGGETWRFSAAPPRKTG